MAENSACAPSACLGWPLAVVKAHARIDISCGWAAARSISGVAADAMAAEAAVGVIECWAHDDYEEDLVIEDSKINKRQSNLVWTQSKSFKTDWIAL